MCVLVVYAATLPTLTSYINHGDFVLVDLRQFR